MLVIKTINGSYYSTKEHSIYIIFKEDRDIAIHNKLENVVDFLIAVKLQAVFIAAVHNSIKTTHNINNATIHPIASVVEFYAPKN